MKKTINKLCLLLTLVMVSSSSLLFAQQELEPFDEIFMRGNIKVYLVKGGENQISIDKYESSEVTVEVDRGVLKIKRKKLLNYKKYEKPPIRVDITYTQLRRLKAQAGAEVRHKGTITSDQFRLEFGSGAGGEFDIVASDIKVEAKEGAVLVLEGESESVEFKATTGALIEAYDLKSNYTYVRASTGAQAEVTAAKIIEASAHTGGEIDYKGSPEKVKITDKLGGEVSRRG